MDNDTLLDKAITAYVRHCKRLGVRPAQPSRTDSTVGRKYVHLANVNGPLARYNITTGEISEEPVK